MTSPCPTDLESIVTCLEISAINLTPAPDAVFTRAELIAGALWLLPEMDPDDVSLVLDHYPTLTRRVPGGLAMR